MCLFFFQAEDGIRDYKVTGVQTCALPIYFRARRYRIETPLARGLLAPEFRPSWSSPPRASETFEDFRRVTLGLDLVVDFLDRAVRADDEGGALDAHHLLAVHVLL